MFDAVELIDEARVELKVSNVRMTGNGDLVSLELVE